MGEAKYLVIHPGNKVSLETAKAQQRDAGSGWIVYEFGAAEAEVAQLKEKLRQEWDAFVDYANRENEAKLSATWRITQLEKVLREWSRFTEGWRPWFLALREYVPEFTRKTLIDTLLATFEANDRAARAALAPQEEPTGEPE